MIEATGAGESPPRHARLRGRVAALMLTVAGALALGMPPEVQPLSGFACALALALGVLLVPRAPSPAAVLLCVAGISLNLAASASPGRTIDALALLSLPVAAFWLASCMPRDTRPWLLGGLSATGAGLALLAAAQRFGLLALEAGRALELGLPREMVVRLASGRPFATHVVPAALAGALVVSLFAAAALLCSKRARLAAGAAALLAAGGLLLTASLGGLLGLAAGAVTLVPRALSTRRGRVAIAAATLVLALVATGAVVLRDQPLLDLSHPDNPLTLRAGNWRGALLVGIERPALGVGLGAFGARYPAHRRGVDSATIYAHNSWLQLWAEGGIPALVLLASGLLLAIRRARTRLGLVERVALAGGAAFAAHNLFDFTLYLPGVALPAAALAGLAFHGTERAAVAGRAGRAGAVLLAALLAAAGGVQLAHSASRHALERAEFGVWSGEPAPQAAWAAAARAPWSPRVTVRAGSLLLASPGWTSAAAALAERAVRIDPDSPAPWHLLARVRLEQRRASDAWRAFAAAERRHPADPALGSAREQIESALASRGLLVDGFDLAGPRPPPPRPRAASWDDLLLLLQLAAVALVCARWWSGRGAAPPEALALCLVLLFVPWGDGGALPGARLGRQLLIATALAAALWGALRHGRGAFAGHAWRAARWLALPAGWAALSAALAPDGAAARDGLASFLASLAVLALACRLSTRLPGWPRVVSSLITVASVAAMAVWIAQSAGVAIGADVARWARPFAADPLRPAADFLHPGHLGTVLVAAGLLQLGLAARSLSRGPLLARGGIGTALVVVGLLPGARASLLALLAGACVLGAALAASIADARARRHALAALAAIAVLGGALGAAAVAERFSSGDGYAWERLRVWPAALEAVATRPLTGFGPDGFATFAATYAVEDTESVARWGRVFRGPHSDVIAAALCLGLPGAILLLAGLAPFLAAGVRALRREPAAAGMLAALAALGAHGAVDDLFGERPAAALFAVVLLGTVAGRAWPRATARNGGGGSVRARGPAFGIALVTMLVAAVSAGEILPYAAFRAWRAGAFEKAVHLDPHRAGFRIAAATGPLGGVRELLRADAHSRRATLLTPESARAWRARAGVLTAACLGPLSERNTCDAGAAAWGAALARRPHDVAARRARARLRAATGAPSSALGDLHLALRDEPYFLAGWDDLVRVYGRTEDASLAERARRARDERIRELDGFRPATGYERSLLLRPGPRAEPGEGTRPR